eukprot:1158830-Pelagomonas_calceolata.AAC.3
MKKLKAQKTREEKRFTGEILHPPDFHQSTCETSRSLAWSLLWSAGSNTGVEPYWQAPVAGLQMRANVGILFRKKCSETLTADPRRGPLHSCRRWHEVQILPPTWDASLQCNQGRFLSDKAFCCVPQDPQLQDAQRFCCSAISNLASGEAFLGASFPIPWSAHRFICATCG